MANDLSVQPITSSNGHSALAVNTWEGIDAMAAHEPAWRRLEASARRPVLFQSYDWCMSTANVTAKVAGGRHGDLRTVVVKAGRDTVLIWPLAIVTTRAGRIVTDATEPFGQYSDALTAPGFDAEAAMAMALDEIASWGADALVLRKLRDDAAIAPAIKHATTRLGPPTSAPFVDFSGFQSFGAYHATVTAKTRKNLRNYRNRLAREGAVVHRRIEDPDERKALTLRCLTMRKAWLADTGLSSAAFDHPAFDALVAELAAGDRPTAAIELMELALITAAGDRTTLSLQWGFRHNGTYTAFMSAKNPAFDAFSPGRLHLEDVLRTCFDLGMAKVDFLMPDMPYKSTWATGAMALATYGKAFTLRGRVLVDVWYARARPALKEAVFAAPPSVRRLVMRQPTIAKP
ncbi:MAG: GNAT family N-acetyltransferase [Hyphomicrobiaceae bacterium]